MLRTIKLARILTIGLCVVLTLLATLAFAHLCNNIYRVPDRVIVKPEKPTAVVAGTEEFRVFVQNNYPTLLNNVRLSAKINTDTIDVAVTPDSVKKLKAGERIAFNVKLTQKPGAKGSKYALDFSIAADQLGFRPVADTSNQQLKDFLKSEGNTSATVQAAEDLVQRGDPAGTDYLKHMISGRDREYRGRAIRAMGKGGDKANISVLRPLLNDQDGFIKGNALLALGVLKDDASSFTANMDDRDEFVAASAAAGLMLSGSKNAAALTKATEGLKSDNVFVRIACGWALASRRNKDGIAALDKAFDTNDATQRVMAGDAMVNVAGRP